jgi:hypothetical protein
MRAVVICPRCDASLTFDHSIKEGASLSCSNCAQSFVVQDQNILRNLPENSAPALAGGTHLALKPARKAPVLQSTPFQPPATEDTQPLLSPPYKSKVLTAAPFAPPPREEPSRAAPWTWILGAIAFVLFLAVAGIAAVVLLDSPAPETNEPVFTEQTKKVEPPTAIDIQNTSPKTPEFLPNNSETTPAGEPTAPKAEPLESAPKPLKNEVPNNQEPQEPPVKNDDPPIEPVKAEPEPKTKVVLADPKAGAYRQLLPPDKQEKVNQAIDKGVKFLRATQSADGRWGGGSYEVGYTALPGLTLLECGVDPKDPAVQKAAHFVRAKCPGLNHTYQLSLAILFLDRLGEPRDRNLIQLMALRLIAGQTTRGGWSYTCPLLSDGESYQLITFLNKTSPLPLQNLVGPETVTTKNLHPLDPKLDLIKTLPRDNNQGTDLIVPVDKDKKGQLFPLVPRNDPSVPPKDTGEKTPIFPIPKVGDTKPPESAPEKPAPDPAPVKNDKKPTAVPNIAPNLIPFTKPFPRQLLSVKLQKLPIVLMEPLPKAYRYQAAMKVVRDDNSNTQFAMMALWVARRHGIPAERVIALVDQRYLTSQNSEGAWSYHYEGADSRPAMTCAGLIGLALGHASQRDVIAHVLKTDKVQPIDADPNIQGALRYLGKHIGDPAKPGQRLPMQNIYYLWSVERVAMLYNLKTIGNKDWYHWASDVLVQNQRTDGSWAGGGYHGSDIPLDTCFALLVLRRANLVEDLTQSLTGYVPVTDPDAALKKIIVPQNSP